MESTTSVAPIERPILKEFNFNPSYTLGYDKIWEKDKWPTKYTGTKQHEGYFEFKLDCTADSFYIIMLNLDEYVRQLLRLGVTEFAIPHFYVDNAGSFDEKCISYSGAYTNFMLPCNVKCAVFSWRVQSDLSLPLHLNHIKMQLGIYAKFPNHVQHIIK